MGQFVKAKYAWMVPTSNGVVEDDSADQPGTKPIYKIPVDEVEAFKAKWDFQDFKFIPLYSGVTELPSPEVKTRRKASENSS